MVNDLAVPDVAGLALAVPNAAKGERLWPYVAVSVLAARLPRSLSMGRKRL
jgi:hypothetical protein